MTAMIQLHGLPYYIGHLDPVTELSQLQHWSYSTGSSYECRPIVRMVTTSSHLPTGSPDEPELGD